MSQLLGEWITQRGSVTALVELASCGPWAVPVIRGLALKTDCLRSFSGLQPSYPDRLLVGLCCRMTSWPATSASDRLPTTLQRRSSERPLSFPPISSIRPVADMTGCASHMVHQLTPAATFLNRPDIAPGPYVLLHRLAPLSHLYADHRCGAPGAEEVSSSSNSHRRFH